MKSVCATGNATVKDEVSFLNGVVGALVGVIYYPSTVDVHGEGGSGGKSASITMTAEQLRKVGRPPEAIEWARGVSDEKATEAAQARGKSSANAR